MDACRPRLAEQLRRNDLMGNLTERTMQRIVNIVYVFLCIVVVVLVLWFIGAI